MKVKNYYMCGIEYEHEWEDCDDIPLYPSVDHLKATRGCWKQCGIVEVRVSTEFVGWVEPQDFSTVGDSK